MVVTATSQPAPSGCNMRVTSSTLQGSQYGMIAYGCFESPEVPIAIEVGGSTPDTGVTFTSIRNALSGVGLRIQDCVARALVRNSSFVDSDNGIVFMPSYTGTTARTSVNFVGNTFERLSTGGIGLAGTAAVVDSLENNTFRSISNWTVGAAFAAIALGINGSDDPAFPYIARARNNRFIGNDVGFDVRGGPARSRPFADFGTAADPGSNVFRCNSAPVSVSRFVGGDVVIESDADPSVVLPFAGNYWDRSVPLLGDASNRRNGTDIAVLSPNSAPMFDTSNPQLSPDTCPAGQLP